MKIKTIKLCLFLPLSFFINSEAAPTPNQQEVLDSLVAQIDMQLYDSSKADIKAWLDAQIANSGKYSVYDYGFNLDIYYNVIQANFNRGGFADVAAQFFRAYEMFGDTTYLNAGLKTANLYIRTQQSKGNFPSGINMDRDANITEYTGKHPENVARFEDGYQYRPFAMLLYAYRLTDDTTYFIAAKRNADMVKSIQDSSWGWLPSYATLGEAQPMPAISGRLGVSGGGSWADAASNDGFRTTIMMYHLTGDTSYLVKSAQLANWVFKTQLGNGEVAGWGDNFNELNSPISARHHEGLLIDPRNFNRYAGPTLLWFYVLTGDEKYYNLFEKALTWWLSVEQPDGFAHNYSYDGEEAETQNGYSYRFIDFPEREEYIKRNASLESMKKIQHIVDTGGLAGLQKWYSGKTSYTKSEFIDLQIEAAKRCTDPSFTTRLQSTNYTDRWQNGFNGPFLDQVKLRLAQPDSPNLPELDYIDEGRDGLARQSWLPIHKWLEPYRPPYGWSSWQYVWDVSLALGYIDTAYLATGGRGLELKYAWEPWDVMGNWEGRAVCVKSLLDAPVAALIKSMSEEELVANKPDLDTVFVQPASSLFYATTSDIVSIYPNPATTKLILNYSSDIENTEFSILNLQGAVLFSEFNSREIYIEKLPGGMYILKYSIPDKTSGSIPFIKQ